MGFVLKKDGAEIARHSTRIACVVEAHELGFVVHCGQNRRLVNGVGIERDRSRETRPLSEAPRKQEGSA